jgi:hypothetical protein
VLATLNESCQDSLSPFNYKYKMKSAVISAVMMVPLYEKKCHQPSLEVSGWLICLVKMSLTIILGVIMAALSK